MKTAPHTTTKNPLKVEKNTPYNMYQGSLTLPRQNHHQTHQSPRERGRLEWVGVSV